MLKYEDCAKIIDEEIEKRRYKWTLKARPDMDYDDVGQEIRMIINRKWHLYDQTRPLHNWLNRVIHNAIINLLRDKYYNVVSPCTRCPLAGPDNHCVIYGEQSSLKCNLFVKWNKKKKQAYNTKLPVSIENHSQEVSDLPVHSFDIDRASSDLHIHMQKALKKSEWIIYNLLYIEHRSEEYVMKKLGLTSDDDRTNTNKRLRDVKKIILTKAREILKDDMEF